MPRRSLYNCRIGHPRSAPDQRGQSGGGAIEDKVKGKIKGAAGAFTGDEEKKAEGRAQQRKGEAREQATQKQRTRQEQEKAEQAEKERDRQERKDKGLLGGLGDTLSGR